MYFFEIKNCNWRNCRIWIFVDHNCTRYQLRVIRAMHVARAHTHILHINLHLRKVFVQIRHIKNLLSTWFFSFFPSLLKTSIPKKRKERAKRRKRGDTTRLYGQRPVMTNWIHFSKGDDKRLESASSTSLRRLSVVDADKR